MVMEGNMDMGKVPKALYRRAASLVMSTGDIAYPIVAAFLRMVHLRLLAETFEELESLRFVWEEQMKSLTSVYSDTLLPYQHSQHVFAQMYQHQLLQHAFVHYLQNELSRHAFDYLGP